MRTAMHVAALVLPAILVQLAQGSGDPWPFIRDVGFPVAVACFVLFRIEPALKNLTDAINELRVELARERAPHAPSRQSAQS